MSKHKQEPGSANTGSLLSTAGPSGAEAECREQPEKHVSQGLSGQAAWQSLVTPGYPLLVRGTGQGPTTTEHHGYMGTGEKAEGTWLLELRTLAMEVDMHDASLTKVLKDLSLFLLFPTALLRPHLQPTPPPNRAENCSLCTLPFSLQ